MVSYFLELKREKRREEKRKEELSDPANRLKLQASLHSLTAKSEETMAKPRDQSQASTKAKKYLASKLLTNNRPTQLLLVANSSTGVQHLICDVSDIGGSFDLDLKTPVVKLTPTRKEKISINDQLL